MMKNNFFIVSIKKNILPALFYLFTICLILFSNSNLTAAKNGLSLWANSVVPSLLPFFIATELLSYTNIVNIFGKFLNKLMRPIFNVPGEGAYAFIMGIISGYPVGAKIVCKLKEEGKASSIECERLLSFTNNSGPLFIIGTLGISFLGDTQTGFLLFITHILACITVGFCFRFWKTHDNSNLDNATIKNKFNPYPKANNHQNLSLSNLGDVLSISIKNAIKMVVMIGGFVVLFSVITSMLSSGHVISSASNILYVLFKIPKNYSSSMITGIIELTNGLKTLCNIHTRNFSTIVILSAFLLGFGGFSVVLQVLSVVSKANISIKPYVIGKFLQGIFASIYTYIILHTVPMFSLNLKPVFANLSTPLHNTVFNFNIIGWIVLTIATATVMINYRRNKKSIYK